jgi:hypothetical protein
MRAFRIVWADRPSARIRSMIRWTSASFTSRSRRFPSSS